MDESFHIEDVHALVDGVLGGAPTERTSLPAIDVPFSYFDTQLLQRLTELLPQLQIHAADIQVLLDDLRSQLVTSVQKTTLPNLHSITRNCHKCPALQGALLPFGNLAHPDIAFVLDQPVREWPPALRATLENQGLNIEQAMVTFATRCPSLTTRPPTADEVRNCAPYLFAELQLLAPKLIVPVGSTVSSLFINPLKISEEHGMIFWLGPWAVMPVYALAYLDRTATAAQAFTADLARAREFLIGYDHASARS